MVHTGIISSRLGARVTSFESEVVRSSQHASTAHVRSADLFTRSTCKCVFSNPPPSPGCSRQTFLAHQRHCDEPNDGYQSHGRQGVLKDLPRDECGRSQSPDRPGELSPLCGVCGGTKNRDRREAPMHPRRPHPHPLAQIAAAAADLGAVGGQGQVHLGPLWIDTVAS